MGVCSRTYIFTDYLVVCDICGRKQKISSIDTRIYKGRDACRTLGWSFGRNGLVKCSLCRDHSGSISLKSLS